MGVMMDGAAGLAEVMVDGVRSVYRRRRTLTTTSSAPSSADLSVSIHLESLRLRTLPPERISARKSSSSGLAVRTSLRLTRTLNFARAFLVLSSCLGICPAMEMVDEGASMAHRPVY